MASLNTRAYAFIFFGVIVTIFLACQKGPVISMFPQNTASYQAPFPDEKSTDELIIPHSYNIHLFPGHSIDDLDASVDQDIKPLVGVIVNPSRDEEKEGLIFSMYRVEDVLLLAIRAYRGVEMVERNYRAEPDADLV